MTTAALIALATIAAPAAHASAPPAGTGCLTQTTTYPAAGGPVAIPTGPATVMQAVTVASPGTAIEDVDAFTAITHTFPGDLDMTLTSPAGTVVTLTTDNAGTNDNVFNGTLWDDDAGDTNAPGAVSDAVYAVGVVQPTLAPEEAMAAFDGENPNGTWTLTIDDDAAGDGGSLDALDLRITTRTGAQTTAVQTADGTGAVPLPDVVTTTSTATVAGAGTRVSKIVVHTNITHTFPGDLDMTLTSPAGTVVTLSTDNAGTNDNVFAGTTWDDDANDLVTDHVYALGVVASPLVAEEALGAFVGEDPNGTWTLSITDDAGGDTGTLVSWDVAVTTATCAPPSLTVAASPGVTLGGATLTDSATVGGLVDPLASATVDFKLFGPDDPGCAGTPVFESPDVPYPTAGAPVTSAAHTPTRAGTYRWRAFYSGEANNLPNESACGAAGQSTVVARKPTTVATTASPAGGALTASATVNGRALPVAGGTVSFFLYGPDDATCARTPAFTPAAVAYPIAGGPVTSAAFTPARAGTYRWVASYAGDANNAPSSGACGAAGSVVAVSAGALPGGGPGGSGGATCAGKAATIVGSGRSKIDGTAGNDVIVGTAAAEQISGRGGNDTICAGGGKDVVRGGAGKDTLRGDAGADKLFGDAGDDTLLGGAGADDLRGGGGKDRLGGGDGNDRVDGGGGADKLDEKALGGRGRDRLFGGAGNDVVRTAGGGIDRVDCGLGRDSVRMDRFDRQRRCEAIRRA